LADTTEGTENPLPMLGLAFDFMQTKDFALFQVHE
jgi:hypothetical protein